MKHMVGGPLLSVAVVDQTPKVAPTVQQQLSWMTPTKAKAKWAKLLSLSFIGAVIMLQNFLMEFPPATKIQEIVSFQRDYDSFALLIIYLIARNIKKTHSSQL